MLFSAPISFREALDSRKVKALMPTVSSSNELARLGPEILERATFSARTSSIEHLAQIEKVIGRILTPGQAAPGESVNNARARELLRESLAGIGYSPEDVGAAPGSLRDLASERRLNLIVDMNVGMARGYGQWKQGQTASVLDQWPAQELVRIEERRQHRDWINRWRNAGGRVFAGGRMVALKNDPVWTELSAFGVPYPPFDYGSGMGVEDVSRSDAVALGLIDENTQIPPEDRGFNADLQADLPPLDRQSDLFQAIRDSLGDSVDFIGNVLRFKRAT